MRKTSGKIYGLSSYLVTLPAIISFLILSLLANLAGHSLLSAFLMFTFLLAFLSRCWSFRSLRNVEVEVGGGQRTLFSGQVAEISYTVRNRKLLPLLWLELMQQLPPNDSLLPDAGLERYELTEQELESDEGSKTVFKKKLSFLMSYAAVSWKTRFRAVRRGLYRIETVELHSGDGFGLAQCQSKIAVSPAPMFVVYPRIVPVRPELFLKDLWNSRTGSKGYFEDVTVIRGTRAYQNTDSWKHIDWRMAARQEELQVKLFETIQPRAAHFIIDGASFQDLSADYRELEETLSVIASLILKLDDYGMRCGISLPATESARPVDLFPRDDPEGMREALFHLSGFDGTTARSFFDREAILSFWDAMGQVYFVTYDGTKTKCGPFLSSLPTSGLTILAYRENETDSPSLKEARTVPLLSLKKEEPA